MPAPTRLDLIKARIYAPLASPVLPRELELDNLTDILPALIKYYKYVPIKAVHTRTVTNTRELSIPWLSIYPDRASDATGPYTGNYFYVGVIHHAIRHQLGQNAFNQALLGLNVGIPITNPLENVAMATEIDISVGDTYYEEDNINEKTNFVVGGSGNMAITFGLGHYDVEKVLLRHIDVVTWIVTETYYNRLISVRKTGAFNSADFRLDTTLLEKEAAAAKERYEAELNNIGYMAMTIG